MQIARLSEFHGLCILIKLNLINEMVCNYCVKLWLSDTPTNILLYIIIYMAHICDFCKSLLRHLY